MKLRNKKTGGIWEIPKMRHPTVQEDDISFYALYEQAGHLFCYKSLADLNEDWEDYTPAEPLIKDEKIRKAVRAWAEANNITEVMFGEWSDNHWYLRGVKEDGCKFDIDFFDVALRNLPKYVYGCFYTIAELCGEEEEC